MRKWRTYAGDDDHDEEGVGHGDDGGDAGRDHLLERLDAAEEPDHAEGPHHAEDGDGQVDRAQSRQGENHDDEVHDVPAAPEEGPEPVGVEVEEQLDGEDDGEEHVEVVEDVDEVRSVGGGSDVGICRLHALGLDNIDQEVLQKKARRGAIQPASQRQRCEWTAIYQNDQCGRCCLELLRCKHLLDFQVEYG